MCFKNDVLELLRILENAHVKNYSLNLSCPSPSMDEDCIKSILTSNPNSITSFFQWNHQRYLFVSCSQCGESIDCELLVIHERDKCEFPLSAIDLDKHLNICRNRSKYCNLCGKYVRLCEKLAHDLQFHEGNFDDTGDSSREQHGENNHSSPITKLSHRGHKIPRNVIGLSH